jgi:dihydrofolate synthase/folylpolyglutamate synthase
MNYIETIKYMYEQLPMFQREGKIAYKADLSNTILLAKSLNYPENKFMSIHVAGTNGKGSVSHMIASVLQHAGYKTGLYTSPHLNDFRERIKINGEMVAEKFVVDFIARNIKNIETIQPSFFEMTTLMAFEYFAGENIDIAVIETGLGGRLDSTNIIAPLVSVITNISYDHMDILGNNLSSIAKEKAGIIKKGIPVIIGEKNPETTEVFETKAIQEDAKIIFAQEKYLTLSASNDEFNSQLVDVLNIGGNSNSKYKLDLLGSYQQKNIVTVLAALDELANAGIIINNEIIYDGLKTAAITTGLKGRWQILGKNPTIIADTGHNEDGIKHLIQQINNTSHDKLHIVFGMVKEKDFKKILSLLPKNANYYFTKADIPRALDENVLLEEAKTIGLSGNSYVSVQKALNAAKKSAGKRDLIFIGGSTFVVAEII